MNTQHTPIPWRLGNTCGAIVSDSKILLESCDSETVKFYGGWPVCESAVPKNQEFIIRACNAHERLILALEQIIFTYGSTSDHVGVWDMGRAALAKAKGEL